ncbi:MAG: RlmF-related methyltransferase, partial [Saprospiraceae bacterium]|nr:RlmF-related methyltransferase [Saprospiraceae bacterium]
FLFSIMLSKKISIEPIIKALKKTEATEIKEITMTNGQKISRIIIWSFLNEKQQEMWSKSKK